MPATINKMKVVLCWHMHQPEYRNPASGEYILPWTYLHAIKDYVDMAEIIAAHPRCKAVVNFAPILLEQIDDYDKQIRAFFTTRSNISDPLLAALAAPHLTPDSVDRMKIINACIRANEERLVGRFPPFKKLTDIARKFIQLEDSANYLSEQYFFDLLTWYHIAWTGETVRRTNPLIKRLMEQKGQYTHDDRLELVRLLGEIIGGIIPSYKRLAAQGQVELAFSPYAHPIVPLLLDFKSAKDAMPNVSLPLADFYPGGEERSMWHMQQGLQTFERYFGFKPKGCWPSEGSLSEATLRVVEKFGVQWVASGESVMRNSLGQSPGLQSEMKDRCLHRAYRLHDRKVTCFFRDDGLSDLVGFTYSRWHADDAVANLIHHLENISKACDGSTDTVVPIILDGENAWEYYPENGFYFLNTLYEKLSKHESLELTTFSACLDAKVSPIVLQKLVAGSWVYGTFSTWIGDKDKNRGWDLLVEAKRNFDRVVSEGRLTGKKLDEALRQLAICEGSDWFWWFGDYNPAVSVSDFERLFRQHLTALYSLLGVPAPHHLTHVISHGGGSPETGGVMRPGKEGHHH